MTMAKRFNTRQMAADCMRRIETINEHVAAIEAAAQFMAERRGSASRDADAFKAAEPLRRMLIELELDEWRNLTMWGLVVDRKTRGRIKAEVHQRFLRRGISTAHHWNGGVMPGSWMDADDKAFREMCRKAFAPESEG